MGFQTYSVIHRKYEFVYQSNCITALGLCANRWNCMFSGTRCGSLKHNWTKMTYKNRTYINVWEKSPECLWVETFFKNLVNNIKKNEQYKTLNSLPRTRRARRRTLWIHSAGLLSTLPLIVKEMRHL